VSSFLKELSVGIRTTSAEAMEALGGQLAEYLPDDCVLALHGDLGVGKTTLVRGIARAWQIKEAVTSPTYNLYTLYQGTRQLIHLDAYRLNASGDIDALMIEDFLKSPWCLAVEWPEKISQSIPDDAWHMTLQIADDESHTLRMHRPSPDTRSFVTPNLAE
jgi:tRNA threonylcarbamoyladenosine biosynthesis protein TsaE